VEKEGGDKEGGREEALGGKGNKAKGDSESRGWCVGERMAAENRFCRFVSVNGPRNPMRSIRFLA
jgi:hypothetical protein